MKKLLTIFFALSVALFLTASDAAAQKRVAIKAGSNTATVSGTIKAAKNEYNPTYETYLVRVKDGKTVTATITSKTGKVLFAGNDSTTYTFETKQDRDHSIAIANTGSTDSTYTVTITIK